MSDNFATVKAGRLYLDVHGENVASFSPEDSETLRKFLKKHSVRKVQRSFTRNFCITENFPEAEQFLDRAIFW